MQINTVIIKNQQLTRCHVSLSTYRVFQEEEQIFYEVVVWTVLSK